MDPKLTAVKASVAYRSEDGYAMDVTWGTLQSGSQDDAKDTLLAAHRETARLLSLFGYAEEAKTAAAEAHKAVADFRTRTT